MEMEQRALQLAEQVKPQEDDVNVQIGHAMAEIVADPDKAVNAKISGVIGDKIDNDPDIADKVDKIAKQLIDNSTEKAKNESEKGVKQALYENNISACTLIGINEDTTPKWVVKIAKAIEAFWYAIWCVVASVTVAPIVFLSMKIKIILKTTWVAVLLAAFIYLATAFLPVILKLCDIIK